MMEAASTKSVTSTSYSFDTRDVSQKSRSSISSTTYYSLEKEPKLKQKSALYGDVVNAILLAVGTPAMAYRMYAEGGLENVDAAILVGAILLSTIAQGLAWKYNSLFWSRVGFLGNCFAGTHMELKEWPLKGVCTITNRFQAGVIALCLANVSLSVHEQVIRLVLIFIIGSYVSIVSPYSVYTEDALPGLGGAVLAAFLALYVYHNSANIKKNFDGATENVASNGIFNIQIQKDEFVVQVARVTLAAIYTHFLYHIVKDVVAQNAGHEEIAEGFWKITKATLIASIGSVAMGVFKTNIDQKEQLEVMVRERTKEIHLKNIELRRINIAFEACETAIAITDASRTVIWTNQAFESLSRKTRGCPDNFDHSSIDEQLTDAIVLDDKTNETKLRGAFDFSSPRQDEIEIQGDGGEGKYSSKSQYRVEVTPFSDHEDFDDLDFVDNFQMAEKVVTFDTADCGVDRRGSGSGGNVRRGSFQANSNMLFLVAFNDITADRAREKAEQHAREEGLLAKAMKESMVTLTHELRTPLQGIMGITSLMLEQQDFDQENNPEQLASGSFVQDNAESLGLIMASSSLLLNLINNLLDVKKATANMMDEFLLAPLLASDPIRDAIDFCNPLASISNVNITMDCCDGTDEAFVNANALRLQQVLINMISNAIKYTDQGTNITIRTRPSTVGETKDTLRNAIASCSDWEDSASYMPPESAPVLIFSVSDAGPGIALDQARRLFIRFARLSQQPTRTLGSNTVGQPSGTGLGLNLCHMFVTRMRGWIWAENNSGRGSTFSFCLPLVVSPETPIESLVSQSVTAGESQHAPARKRTSIRAGNFPLAMDYRNLRVLVVDDTLINRKVLDRMLKKIGISQVSTVESGKDALNELFSSGKTYDLVISDLQMPEMSGTELAEAIIQRQQVDDLDSPEELLPEPIRKDLVVVGLTADTSPDVAENCASSGMSDVLYKPITLVEIKDYFQTKVSRLQPGKWYSR